MDNIVIATNELTKIYNRTNSTSYGFLSNSRKTKIPSVLAVDRVSFSINEAESVALIGPNGAGKSTILKMLIGILYPTSGTAKVLNFVPWKNRRELALQIGVIFGQKSQLWFQLTPRENFDLFGEIYHVSKRERISRISDLIDFFKLDDFMDSPVRKLSLGQRMRCELATTLLHNPKMLFLDEPTIGLDIVIKYEIRDLIKKINQSQRTTILLASHDTNDIESISQRALIINSGRIVTDAPLKALIENHISRRELSIMFDNQKKEYVPIDGVDIIDRSDHEMRLSFEISQTSIEEILVSLTNAFTITDLGVNMPSIDSVIRDMFSKMSLEG